MINNDMIPDSEEEMKSDPSAFGSARRSLLDKED